ncbi:hypothetical protein [Faecalibacter bovis]|uniref:Uncharacterized protein n=1 Tax=Faecalibacter bovis TaxID=2898187 RepID=A0ABX7XAL2_9FLAO|nr:hypothetical protein [Faecalibacter bovis]QTV04932.1 hypothetical protein J9309_08995 [Faecalibacter bovis]
MRNIFDYTFYRTAKRHFKRDGVDAFTARLTLSFILSLYSIPFILILSDLIKIESNIPIDIILYFIGFIVIQYFLKKNYKGKYLKLREKWVRESKMEKFIGEIYIILFFYLL